MSTVVTSSEPPRESWTLAELLRRRSGAILEAWSTLVRGDPHARDLDEPTLRDHLPEILESLARCLEGSADPACDLEELPDIHALERLQEGFDLESVAREYALLRVAIYAEWERSAGRDLRARDVLALDGALDAAVTAAVTGYAAARERTLRALDAIAEAALSHESSNLTAFLSMFIHRLRETMPSVDSAAIYLVEGDRLLVQAAVGPAQAHAVGMSVGLGECLAGRAAQDAAPVESMNAQLDERISSPTVDRARIGAAYAVPLLVDGAVVGVAVVASEHAQAFSHEDLVIVRLMASRASSLLALAGSYLARERALEGERRALTELTRAIEIVERGDACFVLDKDWRIILVNEQQERLSRRPRGETLGRVFWEVWPEAKD